jgi:hypothetical protein
MPSASPKPPAYPTLASLAKSPLAASEGDLMKVYARPLILLSVPPAGSKPADSMADTQEDAAPGSFQTIVYKDIPEEKRPATYFEEFKEALVVPLVKTSKNAFAEMITVGRTPNNDVQIPSHTVSKFHGYFREKPGGGGWNYHDSGSATNGTWVSGRRLAQRETVEVKDGLVLALGPEVRALFLMPKTLWAMVKK